VWGMIIHNLWCFILFIRILQRICMCLVCLIRMCGVWSFIIYDASYYSYEYCIIRSIFLETCCVPWYHRFWMMLHIIHTNTATNMTHMSTSYPIYTNKAYQTHTNNLNNMNDATNVTHMNVAACMGWLRLVGSIKLCVSFAEYRIFYRALLQKRPIILKSGNFVSLLQNIVSFIGLFCNTCHIRRIIRTWPSFWREAPANYRSLLQKIPKKETVFYKETIFFWSHHSYGIMAIIAKIETEGATSRMGMGCLRSLGSIKSWVSFAEYGLFYRAVLPKRPTILSISLTKATPYSCIHESCIHLDN